MIEHEFVLEAISPLELYGVNNIRFSQMKDEFPDLVFVARGNLLKVRGPEDEVARAKGVIDGLIRDIRTKSTISEERFLELLLSGSENRPAPGKDDEVILHGASGNAITARTGGQRRIVESVRQNDIVFVTGPAGTGKTYLAVALAIKALKEKQVKKIFLVRPAVEAGENLGFLPGDLREKLDPYLRPLRDALEDMVHFEKLRNYMERNVIEIAPLAYMRGRTLSDAYVILDEAQNATEIQFKMFLTRLGKGGKIIITGDDSQVDLPRKMRSGLRHSLDILKDVEGIGFVRMRASDVVRHPLVKKIIAAYNAADIGHSHDPRNH